MANAGSLICATGATPTPDKLHQFAWAGLTLLPAGLLTYLTDGWPQVLGLGILNRLLDVDNLCAQPQTVPVMFSDADWASKLGDLSQSSFPNPAFIEKVNSWIEYAAYTNFCVCNSPAPPPPPSPGSNNLSAGGCQKVYIQFASAPWSCPSGNCQVWVNTHNVQWTGSAAPNMYTGDRLIVGGTGGSFDCNPTAAGWFTFPGGWTGGPTIWHYPDGQYGPIQASSSLCETIYSGGAPYLTFEASTPGDTTPSGTELINGQFTFSVQCLTEPVGPDPTPTPPPAQPTQPCDSTSLCSISWLINSFITNTNATSNVTNNQITDISIGAGAPTIPKYVLGTSHSVTGIGELLLAGVVGILVQLTGVSPGTGFDVSDPNAYFDTGFVALGNANGFEASQRVKHNGQVFMTQLQDCNRVGYNCQMATGYTITELVIPTPPP